MSGIGGLSSLDDPVRHRLYEYVAARDEPVSRDAAATAVGIGRTLAAYHLDKLAEAGLLATSYARPPGRGGPGAGRPAKRYTRAAGELAASVPPRNYLLLARLLADAVGDDPSGEVRSAVGRAAYRTGRSTGRSAADVVTALHDGGYEPASNSGGEIELRNCPFHRMVEQHTELVCGLNRNLLQGLLDGAGARGAEACLSPSPGRCCVRIRGLHATGDK